MLLQKVAHFNDLRPEFREKLEEKVRGFGKIVRYRFNIGRENPDPERWGGIKEVWPQIFTLDPSVFDILDKDEKRADKSKSKKIALVEGVDEKGLPNRFKKIKVNARDKGILTLHIGESEEDFQKAMFLELHPKQDGGEFSNPALQKLFKRVDETAYANDQRSLRSSRLKALNAVSDMSHEELVRFCDAMNMDSTADESILRNNLEQLAEDNPTYFNEFIDKGLIEYQAAVKQAMNNEFLAYDPLTNKFSWAASGQVIITLSAEDNKNEIEKMAEWLKTGGNRAQETYKQIKGMLNKKAPVNS